MDLLYNIKASHIYNSKPLKFSQSLTPPLPLLLVSVAKKVKKGCWISYCVVDLIWLSVANNSSISSALYEETLCSLGRWKRHRLFDVPTLLDSMIHFRLRRKWLKGTSVGKMEKSRALFCARCCFERGSYNRRPTKACLLFEMDRPSSSVCGENVKSLSNHKSIF